MHIHIYIYIYIYILFVTANSKHCKPIVFFYNNDDNILQTNN